MLDKLLRQVIEHRGLVLVLVLLTALAGLWQTRYLTIDALPDITNVQVQINTAAPGYSPLEVEQRITWSVENALAGLPGLDYTRSLSRYGLSQVTVIFHEKTDSIEARNLITQRLTSIKSQLPEGLEPVLGPMTTGLGEIFMFTLVAKDDARQADGSAYDVTALRELLEWVVRPQLLRVPGVTEIDAIGGYEKQYHISPDPLKLLAYGITLDDLRQALLNNNRNQGAGYLEREGQQWLVRSEGQLALEDIESLVITHSGGMSVIIGNVAEVSVGKPLRTGTATFNGDEAVVGTAMMLAGENARDVSHRLSDSMDAVNRSLPEGVSAEVVYDRTRLVDKTLATVQTNLLEGALLVIAVLFLLLGNLRAALITAAVIPLAMLMTVTGMVQRGVSANLMSLGALDFGLLVDGTVIIVENTLRRLGEAQHRRGGTLSLRERLDVSWEATREVVRPALFGVGIITLVYLPIFTLTGVEGKMFHPMAITVVMALLAAMVLSVTMVPAAIALFMTGPVSEKENRLMLWLSAAYRPVLGWALRMRLLLVGVAILLVVSCLWLATRLGSEFIPQLDEGDIAMHAIRIPGTGLEQSLVIQQHLGQALSELPEVDHVFAKLGTAEVAADPMPPNVADAYVILKPRDQWPDPSRRKADVLADVETVAETVPGSNYEFTQPIQMRFNELLSGVRADLGVKLFGDDLDQLLASANDVMAVLNTIPGAVDVNIEPMDGLPVMSWVPNRQALALWGVSLAEVQDQITAAIAGENVGTLFEGDRRFELVLRMPEQLRQDEDALARLPIAVPRPPGYVPLEELVELQRGEMPNQVRRENGKRLVVITANVRGRDLGSVVDEAQLRIPQEVNLPAGYWVEYGGTFEQLQSAQQRLQWVVPATLVLIVFLLVLALGSLRDALIIFTAVPLALTGGVLSLWLRDMPLSISAAVGFIALSGIAVLNGLVMLSFIRERWIACGDLHRAIIEGATTRLRPVLMTALVASLGFVPMALNTGIGSEVQRPLATVVIGGVISSTLLTLLVVPALYRLIYGRRQPPVVKE